MTLQKRLSGGLLTLVVVLCLAFGLATYAAAAWRIDEGPGATAIAIDGGFSAYGGGSLGSLR